MKTTKYSWDGHTWLATTRLVGATNKASGGGVPPAGCLLGMPFGLRDEAHSRVDDDSREVRQWGGWESAPPGEIP